MLSHKPPETNSQVAVVRLLNVVDILGDPAGEYHGIDVVLKGELRSEHQTLGERAAALAIHWNLGPSYPLIRTLAEGVAAAMKDHVDKGQPLVLVFDADIAKLVGNILDKELLLGAGIISIDGIDLKDFDFIDIGEELSDARAVPVVIKSLIFRHTEMGRGLI